jgi:hypothetical protein
LERPEQSMALRSGEREVNLVEPERKMETALFVMMKGEVPVMEML